MPTAGDGHATSSSDPQGKLGGGGYLYLQVAERDAEGPGCGQVLGRARGQALGLLTASRSSTFLACRLPAGGGETVQGFWGRPALGSWAAVCLHKASPPGFLPTSGWRSHSTYTAPQGCCGHGRRYAEAVTPCLGWGSEKDSRYILINSHTFKNVQPQLPTQGYPMPLL